MSKEEFSTNFKSRLDELSFYLNNDEDLLSSEALIDAFIAFYTDCKATTSQSEFITNFVVKRK